MSKACINWKWWPKSKNADGEVLNVFSEKNIIARQSQLKQIPPVNPSWETSNHEHGGKHTC